MGLPTYGTMNVDWEERVRVDRLREERLARILPETRGHSLEELEDSLVRIPGELQSVPGPIPGPSPTAPLAPAKYLADRVDPAAARSTKE